MPAIGVVFSRFLEVGIATGVLRGLGVVIFYAVLGGMKGITYIQFVLYCMLMMACLVPAIFISIMVSGHLIPYFGFGSILADGSGSLLDKLDGFSAELGLTAYTSGTKSTIGVLFITAALMVDIADLPRVIVRFSAGPKVKDARKSAGWARVFIAVLCTTASAVAGYARLNMINAINGADS